MSSCLLFKSSPCKVSPCLSAVCFILTVHCLISCVYFIFLLSLSYITFKNSPGVSSAPTLLHWVFFFLSYIHLKRNLFTCPCSYCICCEMLKILTQETWSNFSDNGLHSERSSSGWHLKFIVSYCFPIFTFSFPVNLWIFSKNCKIIINKNLAHTILHQFHFVDLNLYNLSWFSYSMRKLTLHASNH